MFKQMGKGGLGAKMMRGGLGAMGMGRKQRFGSGRWSSSSSAAAGAPIA
jgi:hypothetical protein